MSDQYGYRCYNHDACGTEITGATEVEAERKAIAEGWGMGLMSSGQAYYGCADCGPGLFSFYSLAPLHSSLPAEVSEK